MNTAVFCGGRFGRESSSSDENEDDPHSQEETLESDESGQDESDETLEAPPSSENSSGSNVIAEATWRNMKSSSRAFNCTANEVRHFTNELPSDRAIEPIDVYKLFVGDEVVELIVTETNRFFDKTMRATPSSRHSKVKQWKPITSEDVNKLLGILIMMGLNKQPTFDCYWAKSQIYGCDLVQKTMSRNKFELILRFLHFADNSQSDGTDRLYKLKPLIDIISHNFLKFTPGKDVVIDESLVLFPGRTILRQYTPNKAHRYGLKFYKLCTVDGYTWKFFIYKGQGDTAPNLSHSEYVTLSLMEGLLKEGRTLYVDNFYSSVTLARKLLENKTYVCGTLRKDRKGNPGCVVNKKLKRGEVFGKENSEGIKVLKWRDKQDVLMLSTIPEHTDEKVRVSNRRGTETLKPQCVLDYNAAKKGVDYSDQMGAYYSPLCRVRKWYKKAAFELLLGTSVVNSLILFNKYYATQKLSMKQFRESLVFSILTGKSTECVRREPSIEGTRSEHALFELPGSSRSVRKRCRGCYDLISQNEGSAVASAKARRVKTVCNQCEGKPHFCLSCFERTHIAL